MAAKAKKPMRLTVMTIINTNLFIVELWKAWCRGWRKLLVILKNIYRLAKYAYRLFVECQKRTSERRFALLRTYNPHA
jgi:hypothetical protein